MISKSTKVENNKFVVTFDCSPDSYTYNGVTHKVSRNDRHGIQEGITLIESWYRINGGAWISKGSTTKFSVSTSNNGDRIEACARYRLKTLGFHWDDHSYPFFFFATQASGSARWPSNGYLNSNYARVSTDWQKESVSWSGWCKANADKTSSMWHSSGREYRNGQTGSQGWKSDKTTGSTGTVQEYRKSILMSFTRDYYTDAVTSSGISTSTGTPEIKADWLIGDTGSVTVTYKDPYNVTGVMQVKAKCNDKTVELCNYSNSGNYNNNGSKTFSVKFNDLFGENYRGHDVYYYAKIKNNYGSESAEVSAGPQRYNARPTTPTDPDISIIENSLSLSWGKSTDSDGDAVSYCVYYYYYDNNSGWVHYEGSGQDKGHWTTSLSHSISIKNFSEGTKFKARIWSWDGRKYSSNYAESLWTERGYDVKNPQFLYPKSSVASDYPRIVLSISETADNSTTVTYVKWNDVWYNSKSNPQYFSISADDSKAKYNHKQVFTPPTKMNSSMAIQYKTANSCSVSSTYSKTITRISTMPVVLAEKGEYITPYHINTMLPLIRTHASAYGVAHETSSAIIPNPGDVVDNTHVNQIMDCIKTVNDNIGEYGITYSYNPTKIKEGSYITADSVNELINHIKSI